MYEVRRTAGSRQGEPVAKLVRNKSIAGTRAHRVGGDGMSGSASLMNQGDLSGCVKELDRSQSPRSSEEAANHRGAKGGRKVEV
jgi:hypothetical protein